MADIEFGVKGKEQTISSIGQIEGAMKGLGISTVASTGAMAGGFKALTASMMANPIGLAIVGFTALTATLLKCAGAAREDEMAQNKLNSSIGYSSLVLERQAKALYEQHRMTVGEITNVQAVTSQYFKSSQAIQTLTPAIINMAVATGQSTETIAEQLSSAVKTGKGLRQYGIDLKDCKTEQEKLNKISDEVNKKFADQAKAVEDTRSPIKNLGTELAELAGEIGGTVLAIGEWARIPEIVNAIAGAVKKARILMYGDEEEKAKEADRKVIKELERKLKATKFVIADNKLLVSIYGEQAEIKKKELENQEKELQGQLDYYKKIKSYSAGNSQMFYQEGSNKPIQQKVVTKTQEELDAEEKAEEERLKLLIGFGEKRVQLEWDILEAKIDLIDDGLKKEQAKLAQAKAKEILDANGDKKQLLQIEEKYNLLGDKLLDDQIKKDQDKRIKENNEIQKLQFDLEEAQINLISDETERKSKLLDFAKRKELSNLELTNTQKFLIEKKHSALMEAFERTINEKKLKDIKESTEKMYTLAGVPDDLGPGDKNKERKNDTKEMKALKKKHKDELKELEKLYGGKVELLDEYYKSIDAMDKRHTSESTELTKQENLNKTKFALDYTRNVIGTIDQLMEATGASAKERKRLAQAGALISGAEGVLGVIASSKDYNTTFGVIGGPIAMGVQIALIAGLAIAQVAQIEKAKMAYGGKSESRIITGGVQGQDSVNATLMPGEIVYNPRHPNPYLAQLIANTVPGVQKESGSSNNNYNMSYSVVVNGKQTKTELLELEKAIETGTIKALKKAQQKGNITISKSGKLLVK